MDPQSKQPISYFFFFPASIKNGVNIHLFNPYVSFSLQAWDWYMLQANGELRRMLHAGGILSPQNACETLYLRQRNFLTLVHSRQVSRRRAHRWLCLFPNIKLRNLMACWRHAVRIIEMVRLLNEGLYLQNCFNLQRGYAAQYIIFFTRERERRDFKIHELLFSWNSWPGTSTAAGEQMEQLAR